MNKSHHLVFHSHLVRPSEEPFPEPFTVTDDTKKPSFIHLPNLSAQKPINSTDWVSGQK